MNDWIYMPWWSARAVAALALALLVLAVLRWRREKRGGTVLAFRTAVIAVLLFVMLNPQSLLPRDRTGKPKLIVLLDTSESMATRDVDSDSRLHGALKLLTNAATFQSLHKEFDLEVRAFDREVRPADLQSKAGLPPAHRARQGGQETPGFGEPGRQDARPASGDGSDIATALMTAVSDLAEAKEKAGVLLLSDGRATTPGTLEAAQFALARSVPLWTHALGGPVPRYDLWIETASSEALAFSGAEVELSATLHVEGYVNRSFHVEILKDDTVIETRELLPDAGGSARIAARVQAPEAGEHRYTFRATPQAEESDTANNERSIFLRSVGDKARVLVAEGQPHWDTKFLVQTLKRNPQVDLTAVYRLNPNRHLAIVSTTGAETRLEQDLFPRTAGAMNAFDVIVLGRGAESFFDANTETLLTDFVARRGGSVVFARGKPYGGRFQALAKLEPVAWGDGSASSVKLNITEAGRDNPIFDLGTSGSLDDMLERLPALDQAGATLGEKPLAIVLANAGDSESAVLLAYQRYGQGKALSLNASGLWRWSFRETGQEETEIAYQRFWISLLQWLLSGGQFLPGADTALTASRRYYTSEQPIQLLVATRNLDRAIYQPRIIISGAEKEVAIEPRLRGEVYVAEAGPFPPGSYQATLRNNVGAPSELSQTIEIIDASLEKREISADPELMRRIAEVSGGAAVSANEIARLPEVVRRWEASRQLAHRQIPVWDRWWLLLGLIGLLGGEWWLRRREGLL